eukprot:CAMPEP_0169163686 /NCGR_PEP_ID=MMETSP1015-20121227/58409_1 /TAXON_ID=342587 /ORGANISM="Karlodinium micrum, Strain CCMP2283" /LENGTH=147 /DNA_ID=CAMNT_0009236023 /DNA_START=53 /DNA_END=496 /DNA_ORIENTATION=-
MGWVPDHIWYAQKGKGKGGGGGLAKVLQSLLGGGGSWGKGGGKGGGGKGRGNNGMIIRTAKADPSKVVWIGGLGDKIKDKEGNKKLKDHFEKLGAPVKFVNITSKGEGGAIFGSAEEAQVAIASVNGTQFMGKTLEVDVWTKKEKSE